MKRSKYDGLRKFRINKEKVSKFTEQNYIKIAQLCKKEGVSYGYFCATKGNQIKITEENSIYIKLKKYDLFDEII